MSRRGRAWLLALLACFVCLFASCARTGEESGDKADSSDTVAPRTTHVSPKRSAQNSGDKADSGDTVAPRPKPAAATSPMRFADLDGARVAYLDRGTGAQTLVLVHGWASDHRVWRRQIDALSASHRVLAIDLPGHGESAKPARDYSMDLFAAGIAAVMDDAGVDRAVLVAHSNGVPAARQFYRRHRDRTAGLVLVDGALQKMFDDSLVEGFLTQFRSEDYRGQVAQMVDMMPPFDLTEEERSVIREMATAQPQHAIVGGMQAAFDAAIWEEDAIEVPLLYVLAAQPAWTDEYEGFVRRLAPQVDYRVLPDVSHFLMVERPTSFNDMLAEFLEQNAS